VEICHDVEATLGGQSPLVNVDLKVNSQPVPDAVTSSEIPHVPSVDNLSEIDENKEDELSVVATSNMDDSAPELREETFNTVVDVNSVIDEAMAIFEIGDYENNHIRQHFAFDYEYDAQSGVEGAIESRAPSESKYQNVSFADEEQAHVYEVEHSIDPTRKLMDTQDASLEDFFKRPVKIADYEWNVATTLSEGFNPWTLFFENKRVSNRLSNYNLLRATLHLKVLVNGNPFQYGRALMSYLPLHNFDALSSSAGLVQQDRIQESQRPHIFINPTTNTGGEMKLPFFFYKNYLNIVDGDWTDMGYVYLKSLNTLRHANGAADSTTITVFAWAEDVSVSVPTGLNASGITAQSGREQDEANTKGMISGPATAVAKAAGMLKTIPPIAPFAAATEIGSNAVAGIAKLYGYSRPVETKNPEKYTPNVTTNLATTTIPDSTNKLTVDDKQELSIDPRIAGIGPEDQLSISSIAQRESYLTTFDWAETAAPETLLHNFRVLPTLFDTSGSGASTGYHHTALSAAALPFDYWTGSIKFRFQIVASAYHRGRIKVVYDPYYLSATPEYNTNYLEVVDITEKNDFTITVGNAQEKSLIPVQDTTILTTPGSYFNGTRFGSWIEGNGVIGIYVVNELTTPNSTVTNDIQVNVFVSAGDDFEVFVPSDRLSRIVFKPQSGFEPQSGVETTQLNNNDAPGQGADDPDHTDSKDLVLPMTNHDMLNKVYIGESIKSFRSLLKRYNFHSLLFYYNSGIGKNTFAGCRAAFPVFRGNVPNATDQDALLAPYNYVNTVLLHYIIAGFSGWRGGIRWKLMPQGTAASTQSINGAITRSTYIGETWRDYRSDFGTYTSIDEMHYDAVSNGVLSTNQSNDFPLPAQTGAIAVNGAVNPIAEFEVPFYSQYRFVPGKVIDWQDNNNCWTNIWKYRYQMDGANGSGMLAYVAAAEDFQAYLWTGMPRLYIEAVVPLPKT
jgi:hypothetical protein